MSSSSGEESDDSHLSEPEKPVVVAPPSSNLFKNDGSFMEMFKKKMQEQGGGGSSLDDSQTQPLENLNSLPGIPQTSEIKKPARFVGKRKGKALPTGCVAKKKHHGDSKSAKAVPNTSAKQEKTVWSQYMSEVQRYKSQACTEEDSTRRPLVK